MTIADYNESWPRHFEEIQLCLVEQLGGDRVTVEHVGSTAVPGLAAKPIIDIHIVVRTEADMDAVIVGLTELGYIHEGDQGIEGRQSFRRRGPDVPLREPKRDWFPHHLYASVEGARELARHLAFRDHLRATEETRVAYADLKRRLVQEHGHDREAYTAGKTDFVLDILARAGAV